MVLEINYILGSDKFKMISEMLGYEHSYATFYPMHSRTYGFLSFHWYENFRWMCRSDMVDLERMHTAVSDEKSAWLFMKIALVTLPTR